MKGQKASMTFKIENLLASAGHCVEGCTSVLPLGDSTADARPHRIEDQWLRTVTVSNGIPYDSDTLRGGMST